MKHYKDKKVEVRRSDGLLSSVKEQLYIGGRDKTSVLDSMARQLDAVRTAPAELLGGDAVRVHPALVFVDADLPLLSTPRIGGVPCLGTKQAAERFSARGQFDAATRTRVHEHLSLLLPSA